MDDDEPFINDDLCWIYVGYMDDELNHQKLLFFKDIWFQLTATGVIWKSNPLISHMNGRMHIHEEY